MNGSFPCVIEMVRFSCFSTNVHHPRPKKLAQQSAESMSKASEDFSQGQLQRVPRDPGSVVPIVLKEIYGDPSNESVKQDTCSPADNVLKSEEKHNQSGPEAKVLIHPNTSLKKSMSLGTALDLDRGRRVSGVTDSEDEKDCVISGDENDPIEDKSSDRSTHELIDDLGYQSPGNQPLLAKSCYFPDMGPCLYASNEGSSSPDVDRGGSCEDLNTLDEKGKATECGVVEFHTTEEPDRDDDMLDNTKGKCISDGDGYEYDYYNDNLREHLALSRNDGVETIKEHEGESSLQNVNALPNKDFKTKRIEEWVSMIDLEESGSLPDTSESSHSIDRVKKGSHMVGSASTPKVDSKGIHGMEAAKNYVSSLPAASTAAQLANLGLVMVPFLGAFANLKTLNLSGNAIVKITSGALPRGLHVLNLAKNNISVIEGLRELTRLRVLDLSYNKILRIGHGLASCSSLKELYLAGNKISEVEGLHRLLKLNVLDLRFNKISTAKCLGQLAANYTSLQAVNLEGNPAQRNVGDDQLKKYLQSILPHLVYYNKQTIKASSSKEVSGRSVIASHQLDRSGLRSEHKLIRKGNSIVASGKVSSSSSHGHRVQVVTSPVQPKDRLGRLPPSGAKTSHRHHYLELGTQLLGLRSDLSMRRSRSEGNLEAS